MLFVQFQMRTQFKKLKTEQMNPNERIMTILKFIEQNHKGIFKCVISEIRYCVKMISTGQLTDVERLNREISENLKKRHMSISGNEGAQWAEAITNANRMTLI